VNAIDLVRAAVHVREAGTEDLDTVLDIYALAGLDGGLQRHGYSYVVDL
jgi:hypothetical protein